MDYLDSIDCSLEDFQAMLYEKQFGIDFDALEVKLQHQENSQEPGLVLFCRPETMFGVFSGVC